MWRPTRGARWSIRRRGSTGGLARRQPPLALRHGLRGDGPAEAPLEPCLLGREASEPWGAARSSYSYSRNTLARAARPVASMTARSTKPAPSGRQSACAGEGVDRERRAVDEPAERRRAGAEADRERAGRRRGRGRGRPGRRRAGRRSPGRRRRRGRAARLEAAAAARGSCGGGDGQRRGGRRRQRRRARARGGRRRRRATGAAASRPRAPGTEAPSGRPNQTPMTCAPSKPIAQASRWP